ncbi:non-ribosomal peptide synthase/polyketide synthase [Actinomadura sp. NTSP31]|uniref:non-ribosomal peptide synthase/polyketide synthase n=1 Tax=Actinomadura sp. NTSP31 TaxID=1735447 RepID=UPI0035C05BA9
MSSDRWPASPAQADIWVAQHLDPENPQYNCGVAFAVDGVLDDEVLRAAVDSAVAETEPVRLRFTGGDDGLRAHGDPDAAFPLRVLEMDEDGARAWMDRDLGRPVDLTGADAALTHVLFVLPGRRSLFYLRYHHILLDAYGAMLYCRRIAETYSAMRAGTAPAPAAFASAAELAAEARAYQSSARRERDRAYWLESFHEPPRPVSLAGGAASTAAGTLRSTVRLPAPLCEALRGAADELGTRWSVVLIAGVAAYLHRMTSSAQVSLGVPVLARTSTPALATPTMLANELPLRLEVARPDRLTDLVEQVSGRLTQLIKHQRYRSEDLHRDLGLSRRTAKLSGPVVNIMSFGMGLAFGEHLATAEVLSTGPVQDLSLNAYAEPGDSEIRLEFEAEAARYTEAELEHHGTRLVGFLTTLLGSPGEPIRELDLLTAADRSVLAAADGPACDVPELTLPDLFAAAAARHPDHVAVIADGAEPTYAELDSRANRLARLLIDRGAGPERIVALAMPRSLDLVIAVLAVWKSGASYVPIDPDYPADRIAFMISDARPVLRLTTAETAAAASYSDAAVTDADRIAPLAADHPAYVIYTSGSTGRPKGVVITHAGLMNFTRTQVERLSVGAGSRVLQFASPSFDASVWELAVSLLSGATLVLAHEVGAPLLDLLRRREVTHALLPPSLLPSLSAADLPSLGVLVVGGEATSPDAIKRWSAGRRMFNAYGQTESTVYMTLSEPLSGEALPSVGRPIGNMRVHVLDDELRPVPPGVVGELYVGGVGLGRGYLDRPGLTASRFVADPFGERGERLYRSGDLGRWDSEGRLWYAGRVDDQVKVRGFRVEPGEIESVLGRHDSVAQVCVIIREDQPGERRLVAYVVPAGGFDPAVLRAHAAAALPAYMVPAAFVRLEELPLTANGKVERSALPAPDFAGSVSSRPPRNAVEETLCRLFAEVAGLDRVGIDDGFFELGGDSISSIQLVSRARGAGLTITPRLVFEHPTVAGLAAVVQAALAARTGRAGEGDGALPGDGVGPVPPTPIMRWLDELGGSIEGFTQSMVVDVPAGLDEAGLLAGLQALLDHHDVLRMRLVGDALVIGEPGSVSAAECLGDDDPDPRTGPVLRAAWHEAGRLRLTLHHLAVDGVSWRILLPDLQEAWAAIAAGRTAVLAPVGTSFRRWAGLLAQEAPRRTGELDLWASMLSPDHAGLVPSRGGTPHRRWESIPVTVPADLTEALLTRTPARFHAGMNEILLAGLALGVADWRRRRGDDGAAVLVDLEGHGREEFTGGVDLSRTAGWFTSLFPVRLEAHPLEPGRTLKDVKERLRTLPDHGLGYGLLRYLNAETAPLLAGLATPQIGFNYLGRFDEEAELAGGIGPDMPLPHLLDVNVILRGGSVLEAAWSFATDALSEEDIRQLAEAWVAALGRLASATDSGGHSPSDFPLVRVGQAEIDEWDPENVLPLTPLQEGLLFHALFDDRGTDVYNVQLVMSANGIDPGVLRARAERLVARHAGLRAGFRQAGAGAVQVISRSAEVPWREVEVSSQEEFREVLAAERAERFDMARPPLLRFLLVRLGAGPTRLVLTNHHILLDGWSMPLVLGELLGETPADPVSCHDYLAWLANRDRAAAEQVWREALAGVDEPTLLQPGAGAADQQLTVELPRDLSAAISALARGRGLTLNSVFQGLWGVLVARLTGREDVVFGMTVSGRPPEVPGVERMVGLLINTVPVRVRLAPAESLSGLLARLQEEQSRLGEAHFLGLTDIQRLTGLGELFDSLYVFENYPVGLGGVLEEIHDNPHYPVNLTVVPGDTHRLRMGYRSDVIDEDAARSILGRLGRLAEVLVADPDAPVGRIGVLDEVERGLLAGWNETGRVVSEGSLSDLFEAQVVRSPDAVAVECGDVCLSYGELEEWAGRFARWLVAQGVGPEQLVALALPSSVELVVAILGVHKAGAAYLPVDLSYPAERVAFMLDDAAPVLTVTDRATVVEADAQVPVGPVVSRPEQAAYVIYTSGSTGTPKGVVVSHTGVASLALSQAEHLGVGVGSRVLQFASPSFDASFWELVMALLSGATLVLPGQEDALSSAATRRVSHATLPPSALAALPPEALPADAVLVVAGEACPPALVERWSAGRRMVNAYGPTEATVCVSVSDPLSAGDGVVPVGRPIANTRVFVLDGGLRLVPPGVVGELYVAGSGLARGYLGRPGLTASRFVASPFEAGGRLYRTGDLVRWGADGQLVFVGRADDQVKVRGFRVEPGEVETVLARHDAVAQVAVVARDGGLVAYVVPRTAGLPVAELRDHAASVLPSHMVPSLFVELDALPLTPNGKVDRTALPAPDLRTERSGRAARDPREEILCGLFAEVLGADRVGIDDDFFALGGHSLSATRLVSRIGATLGLELPVRAVFEHPTVADLARRLDGTASTNHLPPVAGTGTGELSFGQRRLWFVNQIEGRRATYNLPVVLRLTGGVDRAALGAALADLALRHPVLRTVFPSVDGQPWAKVLPVAEAVELELVEVSAGRVDETAAAIAGEGFDLTADPPMRARLVTDGHTEMLVLVLHHIAADGWSMGPLGRDLAAAYAARRDGDRPRWAPLPVDYADFAVWQRELLGADDDPGSVLARELAFWTGELAGLPDQLALPADRPRPARATHRGGRLSFEWDRELLADLRALAASTQATVFMVLQAGLAAVLTRLGAGTDIPIGSPTAGRPDAALDELVGFFTNTLVLRTDTSGDPSARDLVGRVRDRDLAAFAHQNVPFERVVDAVGPARSLARHPLFQVLLSHENTTGQPGVRLAGLAVEPVTVSIDAAKFDLSLSVSESADGLAGMLEYNADLFDPGTAAAVIERLRRMLAAMVADPDARISRAELLDPDERQRLLTAAVGDVLPRPSATLPDLLAAQAVRSPDAVAVVCEGVELSYRELDERANRLARLLIGRGVGPERVVAVAIPRSVELVVALHAVVRAGAAYLPVDVDYPAERVEFMLRDAEPALLLTTAGQAVVGEVDRVLVDQVDTAVLPSGPVVDGERTRRLLPGHPAYVIYTSGSTGVPKGVVISQSGVVNRLLWMQDTYALGSDDRVLQKTSASFDVSVWEFFWPHIAGAGLVVARPGGHRDALYLAGLIRGASVTTAHFVPSMLAAFLTEPLAGGCLSLRRVICSGEALAAGTVRDFARVLPAELHNLYGPTEASIDVTSWVCPSETDRVAIGRPIANTRVYVLDGGMRLVPPGVVGELYLGGAGLARGYLNRPGLSASRFVADPFQAGERLYRTGDLVRWDADGELVFVGRADDQVKVRGFRVEPGEIETVLAGHDGVAQAAVVVRDGRLVAYVVAASADLDLAGLRGFVAARLPEYMVPAAFMVLDALPLTPNGKLDRAGLPAPEVSVSGRAPRDAREEVFCGLFADVLGLDRVGIDDNFFELGGDSISSIQLVSRAREAGFSVTAGQVFEHQTVAALAPVADADLAPLPPEFESGDVLPLSPLQEGLLFHALFEDGADEVYHDQAVLALDGVDLSPVRAAAERLVARHANLRAGFWPDDGGFVQRVAGAVEVPWREAVVADEEELRRVLAEERAEPFDMEKPPLLRFLVVRDARGGCWLAMTNHHILLDGWSMPLVLRELFGGPRTDPVPYRRYLSWLTGRDRDAAEARWREALAGIEQPTLLAPPGSGSMRRDQRIVDLGAELHAAVSDLAARSGLTLNSVVQGLWGLLLARLTGRTDVVFGMTVSGRPPEIPDLDRMIGLFINTVPVRVRLDRHEPLRTMLTRLQREQASLVDAHFLGLADIQRTSGPGELFDTLYVFENYPMGGADTPPGVRLYDVHDGAHYPVTLTALPGETLRLRLGYQAGLLDERTAESILARLLGLIETAVTEPDLPVGRIGVLRPAERDRLLLEWNDTGHPVREETVPELFAAQVRRAPDATAVVFGDDELTYGELDERADRLARWLIARGAGPERLVGVALPRSAELVVAIVAVLKSGAGYVPIDPGYPAERIAFMLDDARPLCVITPDTFAELPGTDPGEVTAAVRCGALLPGHPAYVIYTSGSTGRPKGVTVTHRGLVSLALMLNERLGVGPGGRVLQFASPSFDVAASTVARTLIGGAALVMAEPDDLVPGAALAGLLAARGVTQVTLPPSALAVMPDGGVPAGVTLVVAGETCPPDLVRRWSAGRRMVNGYGPTEATVCVTLSDPLDGSGAPPIGRPVWNTRVHVLDDELRLVPPGVVGELYVGGAGLARGYLNRPALTASRFVADPFGAPGERLYRTGDLVRRDAEGQLWFVGRADDQVKLRGFRIEPGEVEAVLARHPAVNQVAVAARDGRLVAYLVPKAGGLDVAEVRDRAAAALPAHLVPAVLTVLDALPLTPNGKVDRAALPAPEIAVSGREPRDARESTLCALAAEVLGLDRVGIDDRFFELGGDSISSIQLVSRARAAGLVIRPRQVFELQTVAALAAAATDAVAEPAEDGAGPAELTPIMRWLVGRGGIDGFDQAVVVPIPTGLDEAGLLAGLQALLDHHDVLRMRLDGEGLVISEPGSVRAADCLGGGSPDPRSGAMLRAERTGGDRLRLTVHHLAVDGVSWRILVSDLQAAWAEIEAGRPARPAPVGTSFRRWSRLLTAEAPRRAGELGLWTSMLTAPGGDAFAEAGSGPWRGPLRSVRVTVPAELTGALLTTVPALYHAGVQDVLLAGLALAVADRRRRRGEDGAAVLVAVEGHGREEFTGGLDLSRTVGWFTSVFPVRIEAAGDAGETLRQVKERLRSLPDNGLGYGLLRYLNAETAPELAGHAGPQIGFNYLGRIDGAGEAALGGRPDPERSHPHLLSVNAFTLDSRLTAFWSFPEGALPEDDVQELADAWLAALEALAADAARPDAGGHSPSDFPLVPVSQAEIDEWDPADVWPLSPLQEGLLFHALFDDSGPDVYNVQLVLDLEGVDPAGLRARVERLLARHPNLRAGFRQADAGAVQVVAGRVPVPWREAAVSSPEELRRVLAEERARRFDMARPPLMRFLLVRVGTDRYRFAVTNHHILLDGWSMPLVLGELFGDRPADPVPYRDYLAWLAGRDRAAAEQVWRDALAGVDEPTLVAPSRTGSSHRGQRTLDLGPDLSAAISALARGRGLTLNSVFQGLWGVLLARSTGRDDVVFGMTVSGRPPEVPGVERMVGLLINTVPVRVRLAPAESLSGLLARLQEEQSRLAEAHFVGLTDIQRLTGLGELFDSLYIFENYPVVRDLPTGDGLKITGAEGSDGAHYPLGLAVIPGDTLRLRLDHDLAAFDAEAARSVLDRLRRLVEAVVADPDAPVGGIEVIGDGERGLLAAWNETGRVAPEGTLSDLFEAQVVRSPDAVAVECGGVRLSYGELEEWAERFARWLVAQGVGPEQLVALALPSSVELVVAILGVHKAGAAYLPVDLGYPAERVAFMLDDAAPVLTVTDRATVVEADARVPVGPVVSRPEQAAYVIYTSGSTGTPKGVVVSHTGLASLATAQIERFAVDGNSRVLQFASPSFDASVAEIAVALLAGATLVLADGEDIVPRNITHVTLPPSVLAALPPDGLSDDAVLIVAGEACPPELLGRWSAGRRMVNAYGPTEATVCVSVSDPLSAGDEVVPIGRPIANTRVFVLDGGLRLVPPGVVGELYVAGSGLARGYLGRPGLTASRFVASPFEAGERLYRTGDLVRWGTDGQLVFVGRADDQVKVRGFRVEPGEVETVLARHDAVAQAVVVARDGRLVAYIVPRTAGVDDEELRRHVAEVLPAHLVPGVFVSLDALPLTPNGKVNRSALPAPSFTASGREPRDPREKVLCGIFAEVLGLDRVGIDDGFFELGGDSIISIQLVGKARAAGLVITPRQVFEHRTVAALAAAAGEGGAPAADGEGVGRAELTPVMRTMIDGGVLDGFVQSTVVPVPPGLDEACVIAGLQALLDHHDVLRMRLDGDALVIGDPGSVRAADCFGDGPDPRSGPILRAAWRDPGELRLTAHHLAVDAVSWRILVPDLLEAWTAVAAGREPALPPVITSFRRWTRLLAAEAPRRTGELDLWTSILSDPDPGPEPAPEPGSPGIGVGHHAVEVPEDVTGALLTTVPALFRIGINEVLLTGLALAVADWRRRLGTGGDGVLVDLEGHGREEFTGGIDLSRTVGWFTSQFPVRLDTRIDDWDEVWEAGPVVGRLLKSTKETLRSLPDNGIGYGLLRHLNPETGPILAALPAPRIGFNYLGRADAGARLTGGADPALPSPHLLDVNAVTRGSRLHASWTFTGASAEEHARDLARTWVRALGAIAAHATGPAAGGSTPSDFPLVSIAQAEIESLEAEFGTHTGGRE